MSKFLPTSGFKLIAPEDFDSNKHSSNSPIVSVLEVHLEYPQRLKISWQYFSAPDKKRNSIRNGWISINDFYFL